MYHHTTNASMIYSLQKQTRHCALDYLTARVYAWQHRHMSAVYSHPSLASKFVWNKVRNRAGLRFNGRKFWGFTNYWLCQHWHVGTSCQHHNSSCGHHHANCDSYFVESCTLLTSQWSASQSWPSPTSGIRDLVLLTWSAGWTGLVHAYSRF